MGAPGWWANSTDAGWKALAALTAVVSVGVLLWLLLERETIIDALLIGFVITPGGVLASILSSWIRFGLHNRTVVDKQNRSVRVHPTDFSNGD